MPPRKRADTGRSSGSAGDSETNPKLIVKNTFLELFDESAPEQAPRRSRAHTDFGTTTGRRSSRKVTYRGVESPEMPWPYPYPAFPGYPMPMPPPNLGGISEAMAAHWHRGYGAPPDDEDDDGEEEVDSPMNYGMPEHPFFPPYMPPPGWPYMPPMYMGMPPPGPGWGYPPMHPDDYMGGKGKGRERAYSGKGERREPREPREPRHPPAEPMRVSRPQALPADRGPVPSVLPKAAQPKAAAPKIAKVAAPAPMIDQSGQKTPPNGTTVMIRNIPNRYTQGMLVALLDEQGFLGLYDFVYLPMDFRNGVNLGYAFVNLTKHSEAKRFKESFEGYNKWVFDSTKEIVVSWACPHQGLDEHVERYRNSPVMHPTMPEDYKPMVFRDGVRVVFPPPTKAIRAPKLRPVHDRATGAGDKPAPS